MKKIAILNTTILTSNGVCEMKGIGLDEAIKLVDEADEIISAVGHEATAKLCSSLLGHNIPVNRIMFKQEPDTIALCFKLNGRLEEGKVIPIEEIEAIGYSFKRIQLFESMEKVSDGYHTFEELYFHRMILFAEILGKNQGISWRSKLHADGSMFPGYFIAGVNTPKGQYSYHYKLEFWGYFNKVPEYITAPEWDGHIPGDIERITSL